MNQFNRNEAISAVADDGFLGEEDEDYEDLYNDVNVSEGFFQALKKNEDLGNGGDRSDNDVSAKVGGDSMPEVVDNAGVGGNSGAFHENLGFRGGDGGKASAGVGTGGIRVELGNSSNKMMMEQGVNDNRGIGQELQGNEAFPRQGAGGNGNGNGYNAAGAGMVSNGGGSGFVAGAGVGGGGGGGTTLFVGDLHWWTTDAQLEAECCKYGPVKEVKFFEEKASGKSKGYCQVDFYDPGVAAACKEGMHGYLFNGRPCVVAFASPHSIRRMGDAQANRSQQAGGLAKKGPNDPPGKPTGSSIPTGGNFQGVDNNRGYGRGNWGRGNGQGMGNRGGAGGMRSRGGGMGGRGIMGNGGNGFNGGPPMMHPGAMMGQGFDPAFGPMGRMGNYGGFPGGPAPPFSGMMPSYPPMGGMPGAAPHVNPAFFGRGMPMGGMGMMPGGVDGPNMGMWPDPSMGGWGGEEHGGGRAAESSYGEETASDQQLGDANPERGGWQKEKDKAFERDWSGTSERRHRDDREPGHDRNVSRERDGHDHEGSDKRHRDDRDSGRERDRERSRDRDIGRSRDRDRGHSRDRDRERYSERDHRHKDRKSEHDDEWDGGRSSRAYGKSRLSQEDHHRSRSRDGDYEKRRRLTSE